jgi:hypothetical protein
MPDYTYRELTSAVLVAHQQHQGGCLCKNLQLGKSWADHVAALLDRIGALRRTEPAHQYD